MNIISSNILKNGIGIDIGNNIMNFVINNNSYLPIKKTKTFIKSKNEETIKLYHGRNKISKNNIFLDEINIKNNKNKINIKCYIIVGNILFLEINIYEEIIYKKMFILLDECKYIENKVDTKIYELRYELKITIEDIFIILEKNHLIPDKIKNNIRKKILNLKINLNNLNNQELIYKINILKKKFLL